jgi:hypothetical protein
MVPQTPTRNWAGHYWAGHSGVGTSRGQATQRHVGVHAAAIAGLLSSIVHSPSVFVIPPRAYLSSSPPASSFLPAAASWSRQYGASGYAACELSAHLQAILTIARRQSAGSATGFVNRQPADEESRCCPTAARAAAKAADAATHSARAIA